MKVLMFLADGFEDSEALVTRDLLIRAGIEVTTASISNKLEVQSSFGLRLYADVLANSLTSLCDFACLIFPGGGRGTNNLLNSNEVRRIISIVDKKTMIFAAICAAPMVLSQYGLLANKKYTCFAGCNENIIGYFTANEVETTGNIITARSMEYSIPFALAIIEKLTNKENRRRVEKQIEGLNAK